MLSLLYYSLLDLITSSSNPLVSMQALRLLVNLSTNEHMIQYLYSANVRIWLLCIRFHFRFLPFFSQIKLFREKSYCRNITWFKNIPSNICSISSGWKCQSSNDSPCFLRLHKKQNSKNLILIESRKNAFNFRSTFFSINWLIKKLSNATFLYCFKCLIS